MSYIVRFFRWLFSDHHLKDEPLTPEIRVRPKYPRHVPCRYDCGRTVYVPTRHRGPLVTATCPRCYHERKVA